MAKILFFFVTTGSFFFGLISKMKCLGRTKIGGSCQLPAKQFGFCPIHRNQPLIFAFAILTVIGVFGGVYQDVLKPFSISKQPSTKPMLPPATPGVNIFEIGHQPPRILCVGTASEYIKGKKTYVDYMIETNVSLVNGGDCNGFIKLVKATIVIDGREIKAKPETWFELNETVHPITIAAGEQKKIKLRFFFAPQPDLHLPRSLHFIAGADFITLPAKASSLTIFLDVISPNERVETLKITFESDRDREGLESIYFDRKVGARDL